MCRTLCLIPDQIFFVHLRGGTKRQACVRVCFLRHVMAKWVPHVADPSVQCLNARLLSQDDIPPPHCKENFVPQPVLYANARGLLPPPTWVRSSTTLFPIPKIDCATPPYICLYCFRQNFMTPRSRVGWTRRPLRECYSRCGCHSCRGTLSRGARLCCRRRRASPQTSSRLGFSKRSFFSPRRGVALPTPIVSMEFRYCTLRMNAQIGL